MRSEVVILDDGKEQRTAVASEGTVIIGVDNVGVFRATNVRDAVTGRRIFVRA